MIDGVIKGKYNFNKFNKTEDEIKKREADLSEWLLEMGF